MNKKIAYILASLGLLSLSSVALAQSIPNFLGTDSFCGLLTQIAMGVGEIVGSLGTLMVIIAGIYFLISAGSPERMNTAKKALLYAIIGIVIGLAAVAIVTTIKTIIGAGGGSC